MPVNKAATTSALVKRLLDSGELFRPLLWTPREAYQFLKEIPLLEAAGVIVRVPDWWKAKNPPRLEVAVKIGEKTPSLLGLDTLLDFSVGLSLGGEPISEAEWQQILARTAGLTLIRGKWVEIDRDQLQQVLSHWQKVQQAAKDQGLSFIEGIRLLVGAGTGQGHIDLLPNEVEQRWSKITAGTWLKDLLQSMQSPELLGLNHERLAQELKAELRPYQWVGVDWLRFLYGIGLGACLADDMGLGKTIQVLSLLLLLKQAEPSPRHLLVVPASLIANWRAEIERFTPGLKYFIAHPSALPTKQLAQLDPDELNSTDLVITTYGTVQRLPWLGTVQWNLVILDEAQAIKNPGAKQTRVIKALKSQRRLVLTGTPVENRLADLWSIFDFINPGLLGTAKEFGNFVKALGARPKTAAPTTNKSASTNYAPLRHLIRPYILRRLKTDKRIIADLPDKTEIKAYCSLTKRQAVLYQESVAALAEQIENAEGIQRRGAILSFLLRFKQICNHPSQWLNDGHYAPDQSGKFFRLSEICEAIAAKQEKALVFTQFREMTEPLAHYLEGVFRRPGLILHGGTPVKQRKGLVDRFQEDERIPFFILSVKAGGTGLNLTAASQVIHFDRWWNPAVENQASDRAFRIGQKKNVLIHKFICQGTIEEKIDQLIESKQQLAHDLIKGGAETLLTEMSNEEILHLVSLDINRALDEAS
jgi:non-specific serine/threonine protein kinase